MRLCRIWRRLRTCPRGQCPARAGATHTVVGSGLAQSKLWLNENIADHKKLQEAHEEQTTHLEAQNRWAENLEKLLKDAQDRIVQLQDESAAVAAGYARKVAELEQENREKTAWAVGTETRLNADLAA